MDVDCWIKFQISENFKCLNFSSIACNWVTWASLPSIERASSWSVFKIALQPIQEHWSFPWLIKGICHCCVEKGLGSPTLDKALCSVLEYPPYIFVSNPFHCIHHAHIHQLVSEQGRVGLEFHPHSLVKTNSLLEQSEESRIQRLGRFSVHVRFQWRFSSNFGCFSSFCLITLWISVPAYNSLHFPHICLINCAYIIWISRNWFRNPKELSSWRSFWNWRFSFAHSFKFHLN